MCKHLKFWVFFKANSTPEVFGEGSDNWVQVFSKTKSKKSKAYKWSVESKQDNLFISCDWVQYVTVKNLLMQPSMFILLLWCNKKSILC